MSGLCYWIAYKIDKLFPRRYCWASLVVWAEFGGRLRDVETPHDCRREARTNEPGATCYCGRYISPQAAVDRWPPHRSRMKLKRRR